MRLAGQHEAVRDFVSVEREVAFHPNLAFNEPTPCLLIKRHSFTQDAVMVEYVEGLFRGDMYSYRLKLQV